MSLNCKRGDLARVIYAPDLPPGSEGHICRCLEPESHPFWGTPGWLIDPPLPGDNDCILDAMLRENRAPGGVVRLIANHSEDEGGDFTSHQR